MSSSPSDLEANLKRAAAKEGVAVTDAVTKQVAVWQKESALIARIHAAALPPEALRRLRHLAAQRQNETISLEGREELQILSEESERLSVVRLQKLMELANIRGVSLPRIVEKLDLKQPDVI